MTVPTKSDTAANGSMEITWHPESRLAVVRYAPDTIITATNGALLVETLTEWIGADPKPFGVLADAKGVRGTDADYRALASRFFRKHREVACIALFNMSAALRILTEMFSIGTGVPLKGFSDEAKARRWLRKKGIAA